MVSTSARDLCILSKAPNTSVKTVATETHPPVWESHRSDEGLRNQGMGATYTGQHTVHSVWLPPDKKLLYYFFIERKMEKSRKKQFKNNNKS